MTVRPLRAGIIGAGWIWRLHAQWLALRSDVTVSAVCGSIARALETAAACGTAVFSGWREMPGAAELDLLWVCTPPTAHAEPAIAWLDCGLPPPRLHSPSGQTAQASCLGWGCVGSFMIVWHAGRPYESMTGVS